MRCPQIPKSNTGTSLGGRDKKVLLARRKERQRSDSDIGSTEWSGFRFVQSRLLRRGVCVSAMDGIENMRIRHLGRCRSTGGLGFRFQRAPNLQRWALKSLAAKVPNVHVSVAAACCENLIVGSRLELNSLYRGHMIVKTVDGPLRGHVDYERCLISRSGSQ